MRAPVSKEAAAADPRFQAALKDAQEGIFDKHGRLAWEIQFGGYADLVRAALAPAELEAQSEFQDGAEPVFDSDRDETPWRVAFTQEPKARVLMGGPGKVYPFPVDEEEQTIQGLQQQGVLGRGRYEVRQVVVNLGYVIAWGDELLVQNVSVDSEGRSIFAEQEYLVRDPHIVDILVRLPDTES